ncbi:MAG: hypothetical protein GX653_00185 [Clostridiales bacterium]|nr:hypothetical protein [Clostridiales bacterium]
MAGESVYLLTLGTAAAMGAGLYTRMARGRGLKSAALWLPPVLAILLGVLCARVFYFLVRVDYLLPTQGWAGLMDLRPQGMALGGAVIGVLLGGLLAARLVRVDVHRVLDWLAAPAAWTLLVARLGEYFVDRGQGAYVRKATQQFFPLAVKNQWDEWYYAIFMLEALFALALVLVALYGREAGGGRRWQRVLLLLFLTQVFAESLRAETIKWGFVRVHQLFAALGIAALMLGWARAARRRGRGSCLPCLAVLLAGVGLLIGIEFALDRWQQTPRWVLYGAMTLVLIGIGAAATRCAAKARTLRS